MKRPSLFDPILKLSKYVIPRHDIDVYKTTIKNNIIKKFSLPNFIINILFPLIFILIGSIVLKKAYNNKQNKNKNKSIIDYNNNNINKIFNKNINQNIDNQNIDNQNIDNQGI